MPKVGIISDTHGKLPQGALDAFARVDYIIHAGDICAQSVLWELEGLATTIAVLGNCDYQDFGPGVAVAARTVIGGVRVYVTHLPQDAEKAAQNGGYGLVIHGHTHVPRDEYLGDTRIISPGSASRPRGGSKASVAILDIADGVAGPARMVYV